MLYFTQVSTRTFLSFQAACKILGIETLDIRNASTSSERKGESVEDSLRTFSSYVDLIIMRSPISGLCDRTAKNLDKTPRSVPIINAGSGPDTHPTQAILDIYTIMRSFQDGLEGKEVCFVGDLKRGRTVRSLAKILCLFKGVKMTFVAPKEFYIEEDLRNKLKAANANFVETEDFKGSIAKADVIYMTRLQDEYDLKVNSLGEKKLGCRTLFALRKEDMKTIKKKSIVMHPLPRRAELDPAIDSDPRAIYWRQERNGMWTRTALISMIFGVDQKLLNGEGI